MMMRGAESLWRPPRRQEVPGMADVLEQVRRSGRIYFVKTLTQTAIHARNTQKTAILVLPAQFVRDNGDRIEEWVLLRTHLSHGRSGRPWIVRLNASATGRVVICGGFYDFVADNRLNEGDVLIFVLQENSRSEFEVYTFRRSQGGPLDPDEGDSTSSDEENSSRSSLRSPSHYQNERKGPFTRASRKGKATPSPSASHFDYHRVHKKEPTSDMRNARAIPSPNANHFEYHRVHKKEPTSYARKARATPSLSASHFEYHRVHKKEPTSDTRKARVTPSPNANHFEYHRVLKKEPTSDTRKTKATPSLSASHFEYHPVHKKEPTSDTRERRGTPSQFANRYHWQTHSVVPFFIKRLTATNIGRFDRDPKTHSGQFIFPERFARIHATMIHTPVKLQGIHENSRTHIIACRVRSGTRLRIDFAVTGWSRFVKENRLERGHVLQFTLMSDSYFLVRKLF